MLKSSGETKMTEKKILCPHCGAIVKSYRNPIPTVDIIIETESEAGEKGIVLIKRKNPPPGWAIPGGFVDYGERVEDCALREAKEETSLDVHDLKLLGVYSEPNRDPRHHTISTVFIAKAKGAPKAADDAEEALIFTKENLPSPIAFDHKKILEDYFKERD
jgi:ADP-ribose pyrophosphatase YjhB (NUDIX family)